MWGGRAFEILTYGFPWYFLLSLPLLPTLLWFGWLCASSHGFRSRTGRSWFRVYRAKQRGLMMGGRGQSNDLCRQITKDWQWQGPLGGCHLSTRPWHQNQPFSGLYKIPEAQTQSRGDRGRREIQAGLVLLPPLAECDVYWGAEWEERPRIQIKFSLENAKWHYY